MLQATGRVIGQFFENVRRAPDADAGAATCSDWRAQDRAEPPARVPQVGRTSAQRAGWLLNALGVIRRALPPRRFDFSAFTPLFQRHRPARAMSVPLAWNDDELPIGMQFVGRFGDEATLFRLAGQLERAQPWFSRIPRL